MKFKRVLAISLSLLMLSSCAASKEEHKPSAEGTTSESASSEQTAPTSTAISEEVTSVSETTVLPETEQTEASTLPSESEESKASSDTPQGEPDISDEPTQEEEIIPEEVTNKGTTTEGDEFDIDPDYAYFLVNRDVPLPNDYSIETDYIQGSYELETTAAYYCREMIEAAADDGIDLKILSAYRTIRYQQKLFDRNVKSRMESGMSYDEAYADVLINIALPGTSEHNAGLAVDIVTTHDWDTYEGFEDTEEFAWLQEHAHEYGFILRYLKGKEDITGYIYEPWHYRFIGVKYALDIKESGLCLEEYFELHPQAY